MKYGILFGFILSILLVTGFASAASVTVTQAGADSGSVMKGQTFTVSVTGLSGSGTASITGYPSGFSLDEDYSKSFSSGTTSVTWTTAAINQRYESAQTLTITVDTLGSPTTADSNSFTVKLPPSLVTTVTHSIPSSDPSGSKTIQLSVQNWGETTANDMSASISLPTGVSSTSGSSTQTKSTLNGGTGGSGESWGISWVVSFGTMTAGSNEITITTTSSNTDSKTDTISFTVSTSDNSNNAGSPTGSSAPPSSEKNETINQTDIHEVNGTFIKIYLLDDFIPKIAEKTDLLNALSDIIKDMNTEKENMFDKVGSEIKNLISIGHEFKAANGKSELTLKLTYSGQRSVKNFIVYDKLPKSFARSASDIMVSAPGATVKIVKDDPEYVFIYPDVSPGQELSVTYKINEKKDSSLLNDVSSEVYAENYADETLAVEGCNSGIRRCSGNTLEECNTEGDAWLKVKDCTNGCNSATLDCNQENTSASKPEENQGTSSPGSLSSIIAVIAIILIMVGAIVFVVKKRKDGAVKHPF